MPSIITRDLRLRNNVNFTESFSEVSPDSMYLYFGQSDPWADELNPDTPVDSTTHRIRAYDSLLALKKISHNDITTVIRRIDWTPNTTYDAYNDEVDMIEGFNPDTQKPYDYYVVTDDYRVYKCLDNNNGAVSTTKPVDTSIVSFQTADGYIWKYMYTVPLSDILKYATDDWIPSKHLEEDDGSDQWTVQSSAVDGSIETIEIVLPGSGYDPLNPPIVTVTGDGTGCTAEPEINDVTGAIERIVVTNIGSGFSQATVTIDATGTTGSGAFARPIISPLGGHGSNPLYELGGKYAMIKVIMSGDENGNLPINVDYRQIGLLMNPRLKETGTVLTISVPTGLYKISDTITGRTSGAKATVVKYDYYRNLLYLRVNTGSFQVGEFIEDDLTQNIEAQISNKSTTNLPATDSYATGTDILRGSGELIYINNRTKITRIDVQDEEARFVLSF